MDEILAMGPEPGAVGVLTSPVEIAYANARSVLEYARDGLLKRESVGSVDIGLKSQAGEAIPTVAIRVHVDRKLPIRELKESERIPEWIDGAETDVVECTVPDEVAAKYLEGGDPIVRIDTPKRRGTICLAVRSLHEKTYGRVRLLTCAHVASGGANPKIIDTAPKMIRLTEPPLAGRALRNVPQINMRNWAYDQYFDCALVTPDRPSIPGVLGLGKISKIRRVTEQDWGKTVYKVGQKTGLTRGRIISHVSSSMPLPGGTYVANHIEIEPIDRPFALGGDSGAPVILNKSLVGILRAVVPNGNAFAMRATYAAAKLRFKAA